MILSSGSDASLQAGWPAAFARHPQASSDKSTRILGGLLVAGLHLLFLVGLTWSMKTAPIVKRDTAFMIDFVQTLAKAPKHVSIPLHMAAARTSDSTPPPPPLTIAPAAITIAAPPSDTAPVKPGGAGASGPGVTGGGASSGLPDATGQNDGGYLEMLRRHIAGFMGDPHVAGEVVLRFSIDKQGNLLSYEIAKTSGDWRVDEAAVDMLRRAQPLPPIPDALNVPGFRVTMPLKYKL